MVDRREVMVHWLRVVHSLDAIERVRLRLRQLFGKPDPCSGRWRYQRGERYAAGVLLLFDRAEGAGAEYSFCVDVEGGAFESLDPGERGEFARWLVLGGRVTRIDLAVDAFARQGVGLIDAIIRSCEAGTLCGARVWSPKSSYCSGQLESYGVTIGRRGDGGSGRFVRCYDKGLESGTKRRGEWERFEVEFSDDCASEVAADVFNGDSDWERRALARINGAVSFRKHDANGSLSRRVVLKWWEDWTGNHAIATVYRRVETTLERYSSWLAKAALATASRLARETGYALGVVLEQLAGEVRPRSMDCNMRAMLGEWRERAGLVPAGVM